MLRDSVIWMLSSSRHYQSEIMTRSPMDQALNDGKSRKKSLKPVVEKKRRDRINQSLADLRLLLLNSTSDPRLQNPKIEKAEILDLAVEYLQKWADRKNLSNDCASRMKIQAAGVSVPLFSVESAGFQQCVAQLISFMHKLTPSERASLVDRLKHHTEGHLKADFSQKKTETPTGASVDTLHISNSKAESPGLLCSSHSLPHSCSTPGHDYLSPPPSPWFSPPFSTYTTSPPFPSFACHFSFNPSLSPSSSNTSLFSFSPSLPHSSPSGLHAPQLTTERAPSNPNHREGSEAHASSPMWRPWFL